MNHLGLKIRLVKEHELGQVNGSYFCLCRFQKVSSCNDRFGIVDVILEIVATSPDSGYDYHEVNVKRQLLMQLR